MQLGWGVVVIVLSVLCWGGQVLSWLAPVRATDLGLVETKCDVEPVFWVDIRAEAMWDTFALWPMVVAGVLLTLDHEAWPSFGLVGGGMYLYFAGRGIATRVEMHRRGFRIGSRQSVTVALAALAVWGAMASITIAAAVVSLRGR